MGKRSSRTPISEVRNKWLRNEFDLSLELCDQHDGDDVVVVFRTESLQPG